MVAPVKAAEDYQYPDGIFEAEDTIFWKHKRVISYPNETVEKNVTYMDYERNFSYNLMFSSITFLKTISGLMESELNYEEHYVGTHYDDQEINIQP